MAVLLLILLGRLSRYFLKGFMKAGSVLKTGFITDMLDV
jgi:hypothetical protein